MSPFWIKSSQKIAGYKCIQHLLTKEITLVCRFGEVYSDGENFRAIIYSPRLANQIYKLLGKKGGYKEGDECCASFSPIRLNEIVKLLKPHRQRKRQIEQLRKWGFLKNEGLSSKNSVANNEVKVNPEPSVEVATLIEKPLQNGGVEGNLEYTIKPLQQRKEVRYE